MEKALVTYEAKDGQEISLSFENITKYLVQGHPEYVTRQEMMYFMGICKSRGLNPFAKDCYLIKYSQKDGAAIITGIDYFRKRAKAQRDCKGWKKGIIVKRKGEVVYTDGLILDDDTLLGGWFKAKPEGWDEPFTLEVNLKGYIKKTKDGSVTKFWKPENQPTQIAKVAESQGLRTLWPDEFQQLYTQEELGEADTFKTVSDVISKEPDSENLIAQFDNAMKEVDPKSLNEYLVLCANSQEGLTVDDVKISAVNQGTDSFSAYYEKWVKAQPEKKPEPEHIEPIWDPYKSEIQKRYGADKTEILKDECEGRGIIIDGLLPRQAHEKLLEAIKEADSEDESEPDLSDPERERPEINPNITDKKQDHKKAIDVKAQANYLDEMRKIMEAFPNRSLYSQALKELEYDSMNDVPQDKWDITLLAMNAKLDEVINGQ